MPGSSLIGNLAVNLSMETAAFMRGASLAEARMRGLQQRLQRIGNAVTASGAALSATITLPFTALLRTAIPAAIESRQAIAQVNAALASMGPAAGRTSEQLQRLASDLQDISTFDDDDILRRVTANMLTFGNVAGEQFDRAQLAAVNLSTRMGGDLQASALLVGKALNDPIRGLTQLRRVGIQFTDQQIAQVRAMAATGDAAGAQRIILGELERQFGGSAQAMRNATPGADTQQAWRTFQEVVGEIALRVLPPLTNMLTQVLTAFNNLDPSMQATVVGAAALAAALGPVMVVLGPMISVIGQLIPLVVSLGAGISGWVAAAGGLLPALTGLLPVLLPIAAAVGAVYLAWKNWESVGPILRQLWEAIYSTIGEPLVQIVSAAADVLRALWEGPLGSLLRGAIQALGQLAQALAETFGPTVVALFRAAGAVIGQVLDTIGSGLRVIAALLRGDFTAAWNEIKGFLQRTAERIGGFFVAMKDAVVGAFRAMMNGIWGAVLGGGGGSGIRGAADILATQASRIESIFRGMEDAVTGHSYVPDMIDKISYHFGRLQREMVDPAVRATETVAEAFRRRASEIEGTLDRLFPEIRRRAELQEALANIADVQAGLTPEQQTEARRRAYLMLGGALENVTPIEQPLEEAGPAMEEFAQRAERTSTDVIRSFADMAQRVTGSLRSMVADFKKGDILGGILTLVETVAQVVQAVRGGGGGGGGLSFGGFRANGGPVVPGKYYTVGERGPERFYPGVAGRIVPNNDNAGGIVRIVPSPYFDAVVDHRAGQVAAPMAAAASYGGAAMGERNIMRRAGRRFP